MVMATGWLGCDRAAFEVIHGLRETEEVDGKPWPAGKGHGAWRRVTGRGHAKHPGGTGTGHPTQEGRLGLCRMSSCLVPMQISFFLLMAYEGLSQILGDVSRGV